VYIWVDKDFAIIRGQIQGYPKKLGSMHMTRPVNVGKAGPRLKPGGKFGATLSVYDRRIAEAEFVITGTSTHAGFVNALPMLHNRWMPSIEINGKDSLNEIVTMSGFDSEIGQCFTGDFDLRLFDAPTEELTRLKPIEKIAAYWREVGTSWKEGKTLARNNL